MQRSELVELHYITSIANVPSMLQRGLLSHVRAEQLPDHESLAMAELQDIRLRKTVPNGRPLHEYVNLYFNARNTMLFKRLNMVRSICVLRIMPVVLDLPGVVVTDQNAASGYVRFYEAVQGLVALNRSYLFAEYWTHDDEIETMRHKSAMCAEVLVPDHVPPDHILGAYVAATDIQHVMAEQVKQIQVTVNGHLFFRR